MWWLSNVPCQADVQVEAMQWQRRHNPRGSDRDLPFHRRHLHQDITATDFMS